MAERSRALVRIDHLPAPIEQNRTHFAAFNLVDHETWLNDRAQVERHLPDIMGRALARAWIDPEFRKALVDDPKDTLARCRLHLPDTVRIEVKTEPGKRPMVIVNDHAGAQPRRLLYLQLVLIAGR